jgi:hypothetical protein
MKTVAGTHEPMMKQMWKKLHARSHNFEEEYLIHSLKTDREKPIAVEFDFTAMLGIYHHSGILL